jgi:putative ABC transport system ATP-binding protein
VSILVRNVSKRFGDFTALDDVSLEVEGGSLTALLGPSGSGKSTLLHIMGTLDLPSSGTVRVGGIDVDSLSDRQLAALRSRRVGLVFQQFFLLDGVSALDNVAMGLLYSGVAPRQRRRLAALALARVGLGDRLGHRPTQLSGGEQQRVAVARALANGPRLLLADEPTGNLDSATGAGIIDLLVGWHREREGTLLLVTHDPALARHADRTVELRDGRVVADRVNGRAHP